MASRFIKRTFTSIVLAIGVLVLLSALLMSDLGQWLNVPRSWVLLYYQANAALLALCAVLLICLWSLHLAKSVGRRAWLFVGTLLAVLILCLANFSVRYLFPSQQYAHTINGDTFVALDVADATLADDAVIYAVELKGDVVGFPRDDLYIPHVVGARCGPANIVMVYCGLSNLPVVIDQNIGYNTSDLRAHVQVHNNLIVRDHATGALFQQITGEVLAGEADLTVYPNTMMTWKSFKQLYPEARVFRYAYDGPLDSLTRQAIPWMIGNQFSPKHGPAFPTLRMDDDRLPPKEQVWGIRFRDSTIAFTKAFAQANPVFPFELEGLPLVLVYDQQHDIINVFERRLNGETVEADVIDWHGQTPAGRLPQYLVHNGVLWMVWSHWFPETEVYTTP